jgi:hypothetical protein
MAEVNEELDKNKTFISTEVPAQLEQLKKLQGTLRNQVNVLVSHTALTSVRDLFEELLRSESGLGTLINKTFENLTKETGEIANRIRSITHGGEETKAVVKELYIRVLNQYIESEISCIRSHATVVGAGPKTRGIVTRFSVVGQMVRELLNNPALPVTFHALLVIPPVKFLNYATRPDVRNRAKPLQKYKGGESAWEEYLQANLGAAHVPGRVYRQFLAIRDGGEERDKDLSSEVEDLLVDEVAEQLRFSVLCGDDGVPVKCSLDGKPMAAAQGEGDFKYNIQKERGDNGNWGQLAEVLGRYYHAENCCFVRTVELADFNSSDNKKIGRLLKDSTTKKPLDYFAVRCKSTGQWLFCLRTRYDEDFDVAILDILYPGSETPEEWADFTTDLGLLFDEANRGVEITRYANPGR